MFIILNQIFETHNIKKVIQNVISNAHMYHVVILFNYM